MAIDRAPCDSARRLPYRFSNAWCSVFRRPCYKALVVLWRRPVNRFLQLSIAICLLLSLRRCRSFFLLHAGTCTWARYASLPFCTWQQVQTSQAERSHWWRYNSVCKRKKRLLQHFVLVLFVLHNLCFKTIVIF